MIKKPTPEPIAALLYEETDPELVKTLAGIEQAIRAHRLEPVGPEIGDFLSQRAAAQRQDENPVSAALSVD